MAKKTSKFGIAILSIVVLAFGIMVGFSTFSYINLPETDDVSVEDIYYSDGNELAKNETISLEDANMSIHFLELGNKYTGDCTYIKTDTCDILIDCGSKSNSIPYIVDYLNQYVTDGKLEYVIITHAHQDHYAGFATSTTVDSIFDIYECENIITFNQTNKKSTSILYNNYLRELNDEVNRGAKHYTALDCIEENNGAKQEFNIGTDITLKILNSYFYTNKATTENDYSVCSLISYGSKNFLFTGDLEEKGEEQLVLLNDLPQVDLYKAGHHGSKTSSTEALMTVIKPKTICVCCCAGSPEYTTEQNNQFPTQVFIDNVAKYTKEIYVTTLCIDYKNNKFTSFNGNIVYLCNEGNYNIKCSNNNTILKDSDWFKKNREWPEYGVS